MSTKKPMRKSLSARSQAHDWLALSAAVRATAIEHPTIDFDEQYVHAIQRALVGRVNAPLLRLLDSNRLIHPALLPALADVVRSQTDGAVGIGVLLTAHQHQQIRSYYDAFTKPVRLRPANDVKRDLVEMFNVSPGTINRSLNSTKYAKR